MQKSKVKEALKADIDFWANIVDVGTRKESMQAKCNILVLTILSADNAPDDEVMRYIGVSEWQPEDDAIAAEQAKAAKVKA